MQAYSLAERPDLVERFWGIRSDWLAFMVEDPVARTRYEAAVELFPDLHLLAFEDDQVTAWVHAVPMLWPGADQLPDRGWDWALESAVDNPTEGPQRRQPHRSASRSKSARPRVEHPASCLGA